MAELSLAIISAVAGTLQFGLSLKSYISEWRRRKREQAELLQQYQAHMQYNHHAPPPITTLAAAASPPCTIIYHSISTYNNCSFPAQHAPGAYYQYHQPSSPYAPQYYLHHPIPLPITSSPPALYNSAPAFQNLPWPPYAPNFYPPFGQDEPLTHCSSAPPSPSSPYFPNFYPPLAQQLTTSNSVLSHQNSAPASLFLDRNPHSRDNVHLRRPASTSRLDAADYWNSFLHGRMELHKPHQALQRVGHGRVAIMHTGACPNNKPGSCFDHWMSFQKLSAQGINQASIAVVDWNRGNIDMFVEKGGVYFMNYRISRCQVSMFAEIFKKRQVFSGETKGQRLAAFNTPMEMVDMTSTKLRSTNSWRSLGINDESEDMEELLREGSSFVRMLRGAVFGLVCCLYEAPSHLNVEMERVVGGLDIVRVTGPPPHIVRPDDCIFSVFSFGGHGWASQDILVG